MLRQLACVGHRFEIQYTSHANNPDFRDVLWISSYTLTALKALIWLNIHSRAVVRLCRRRPDDRPGPRGGAMATPAAAPPVEPEGLQF